MEVLVLSQSWDWSWVSQGCKVETELIINLVVGEGEVTLVYVWKEMIIMKASLE